MRVRRLDKHHDWTFGQGRANYAEQSEGIAQCVKTRLWSFTQDWFLDLEFGLPWIELKERKNLEQIESAVKKQVLKTYGVREITAYQANFDPDSRKLTIEVDYIDIYGAENSAGTEK